MSRFREMLLTALVLRLVVEGPVVGEVGLDPGGLLPVARVAEHAQTQDSEAE